MAYNTHSAKRSAEDYVRVSHDSEHPYKKPRFDLRNPSALAPDALEEDATLDADVIGSRGQQVRRGAVNIDGYDSDSENENFDVRAATREKEKNGAQPSKKEEDGDMFADLEEEFADGDDSDGDADRRSGRKKKAVRFLDEDEIEGQNLSSKSGGHVSADFSLNGNSRSKGKAKAPDDEMESSSDSEVDDATRAAVGNEVDEELGAGGKKTHAPKLDAFNMRNENDEGRFDEQGNYVRKAVDADAIHDIWMEGISKKDMKKAGEAHERREAERRRRALEDDAKSDGEILASLIPLLQPSETILEALARLNKTKKVKPKWHTKHKKSTSDHADSLEAREDDPQEKERTRAINTITEAADLLLARGQTDVYDSERELLMRQYQRMTGELWVDGEQPSPTLSSTSWEYRWSDARDGGDIHGPYDNGAMKAWNDAGYFGDGVEFRQIGRETEGWSRVADFV